MIESLLLLTILVISVVTMLVAILVLRSSWSFEDIGREVRDELRGAREESRTAAKEFREEVSNSLKLTGDALSTTLERGTSAHHALLKELHEGNEKKLTEIRKEVSDGLKSTGDALSQALEAMANVQRTHLEGMAKQLRELTESNQNSLDRVRSTFDSRAKDAQEGSEKKLGEMRKEIADGLKSSGDTLSKALETMGKTQHTQLEGMTKQLKEITQLNQTSLDGIRNTFDSRVKQLQEGNEKKLEEMRKTVDEKLHETLEKRLGESFKLVSERLEAVHKGLGEMQNLASGVGDLKRVLTNVKTRGTWAEVQLGAILEQILAPGQYEKNVRVKADSLESVEYAVRLPGPKNEPDSCVWLPIDSKFPKEDYLRVQKAAEEGDADAVHTATESLARTVRLAAKDVHEKYVNPPSTTDFAIIFLATEGLYAEVLRQPTLVDDLLHRHRVVVAGPTTLAAILSSLRMGFQTLAIEQRAAEVWKVLAAVKTEFGKFGEVLERVRRQIDTASRTIEETGVRTRAMERRLRSIEQLPEEEATRVLALRVAAEQPEVEEGADKEQSPDLPDRSIV